MQFVSGRLMSARLNLSLLSLRCICKVAEIDVVWVLRSDVIRLSSSCCPTLVALDPRTCLWTPYYSTSREMAMLGLTNVQSLARAYSTLFGMGIWSSHARD